MKYKLKKHFKNLFEMQAQQYLPQETESYVFYDDSPEEEDFAEEDFAEEDFAEENKSDAARNEIEKMFKTKLAEYVDMGLKTDTQVIQKFNIKVEDLFTLAFIMIKENLIVKQEISVIAEAKLKSMPSMSIDTSKIKNWVDNDINTKLLTPTPDQLLNSRATGNPKKASGGGDELLNNVINSNSKVEFLDSILVLLYRKLVARKKIKIDSNVDFKGDFDRALDLILDTFKDKIIKQQASLSTTFGATFELLINSAVQAFFKDKLYAYNKQRYAFFQDFSKRKNVDLALYIDKGTTADIVSKKTTILMLLFFTGKFKNENVIYKHYKDNGGNSQLSDEDWHSAYAEVFDSINKKEINKISKLMVDYSKKLLKYEKDREFGQLQVRSSHIFCDEYESDKDLYDAANNYIPSLYLPKKNAPFDFIIRTVQQDGQPISFGLFDLKCANKNVKGKTAYDTRKTGNNKSNSAIFNIKNTLKALDTMSNKPSVLKFIGLSELQYELVAENNVISLQLSDLRNICGSPNSSIDECKDTTHMKITNVSNDSLKNINKQSDYITLEKLNSKNITFVKYLDEIGHTRDFALKLLEAEYNGNFNNSANYLNLAEIGYSYIEVLMKIKDESIYESLNKKLEDTLDDDEKVKVLKVLEKVKSDKSFDIKEITREILNSLAFKVKNNVSKKINEIDSSNLKTNAKRKLAGDVLSVFGGRSKQSNYEAYINILPVCGLKTKQTDKSTAASNPNKRSKGMSIGNDFYFSMSASDYANSSQNDELNKILEPINNQIDEIENKIITDYNSAASEVEKQNSSYIPSGKVLKEVYAHLFKKRSLNEGGLAGHMMHPYEALDMTIGQIIDRIKEYGVPQSIIEKVDGQNLFFTVEQDGTLMFARNKEDMTHDDLIEKFTDHPAEVPFVTGGNAIKRGIDQWLSSAGSFSQQEILDIFHPDGEAKSFINFEIMHKDHPNQIEYGENYIVFHSIVDFVDGREAVYSSNNSRRLDKLISLMKPGIESSGYTLASNRTVELNKLTNVQISDYVSQIKKIADSLEINENEFLGDGVQKQIQKKINELGVNISEDALNILYDFTLYGEDKHGNNIKSKDFTKLMDKKDVVKLRSIGLTSASKALSVVLKILSPFKDVFVDLGIDLLDGVPSSYMNQEVDLANVNTLREKLQTAMDDLENYMSYTPESSWDALVVRLKPHYNKVNNIGVYNAISTSVEGGVYDHEGDLLKVTGGFAPMNQILGAAYRDKKGIFPTFKQKFMQQESNRRSLKSVFSSIF